MREFIRTGVTAAGVAAALVLTGCSSGDDGAAADKSSTPPPSAAPSISAAPGASSAAEVAKDIQGSWAGLTDGKSVALVVQSGKAALVAEQHVCQGSVQDMGQPMLSMTCTDGNTDRAMGTITSHDGKTLVISWGTKKDTLKKTEAPGKGLPTAIPSL